jgi:hypothetical protein
LTSSNPCFTINSEKANLKEATPLTKKSQNVGDEIKQIWSEKGAFLPDCCR